MKVCLSCHQTFVNNSWECPSCHFKPFNCAGTISFAPEFAEEGTGFDSKHFALLSRLESRNFWFRARNRLITQTLKKHFSCLQNFLEIGCGTGFVLSGITKAFPQTNLSGSELFSTGLKYARERVPSAAFYQMDARNFPFFEEFDVIGAFDVLEHINEDDLVLEQMYQAVRPGGGIILTVPQHPWLWSPTDDIACHVRRYTAKELQSKVMNAGFQIVRKFSFVSLLLPLMALSRVLTKKNSVKHDALYELKTTEPLNTILEKILVLEQWMIRAGLNFPAGGSLLLVAKKT